MGVEGVGVCMWMAQVVMQTMGSRRWSFAHSPATHLLLCGPAPNREPGTSGDAWSRALNNSVIQTTPCIWKVKTSLTSKKLFSKATRMLVSMLVRFFLLRFKPSIPIPGEFRALGLERAESDERFSVRKKKTRKSNQLSMIHAHDTCINNNNKTDRSILG